MTTVDGDSHPKPDLQGYGELLGICDLVRAYTAVHSSPWQIFGTTMNEGNVRKPQVYVREIIVLRRFYVE